MEYRCEYLIVGGGLAGCSLGYLLRKSGADVLILERLDAKRKDKRCAGLTA
ncbi:MAG: NAD(P)/FAD-dependent oxidoreductase, partial [Spirochaetia bacterium]|nr:NAD(P)/FAD-dependent oxidoreductase [Spirochaetia bacterium]